MQRRIRVMAALAVTITALGGTLAGCSGTTSSGSTGALTVAVIAGPNSMDPTSNFNGYPQELYQQLTYEPLINVDKSGKLAPGLATKWNYVDGSNNTKVDLTIRSGTVFSDGSKVTPAAVAASLNYFVKHATGPTSGNFQGFVTTVTGANQVTITAPTPNPVIPALLTTNNQAGNIISPAGLASDKIRTNATFGAGPYVYQPTQSVSGDHYTFTKNPKYYDASHVKLSKVTLKVIANSNSALQALKSGQIDVMQGDNNSVSTAKAAGKSIYRSNLPYMTWWFLDWEGKLTPALKDIRIRQAMNYAIDRKSIVKGVFGQYGTPLDQPGVPGFDAFDQSLQNAYPYNPEKAKQLLAEAGYAKGFTVPVLYFPGWPTDQVTQAMAAQLQKVGIQVQLKSAPSPAELNSGIASAKYSMLGIDWGGQTQFAQVSQLWLATSPVQPFKNQPVPGLLDAFTKYTQASGDHVDTDAHAVQKVLVDQALGIPVAMHAYFFYTNPKVKGFDIRGDGLPTSSADWSLGG